MHDAAAVHKAVLVTQDPEDQPDALGLEDIDHFTQFIRGTKAPPRDATLAASPAAAYLPLFAGEITRPYSEARPKRSNMR